ncbi:MAG: hypothetical protein JST45_06620 [Bacteroidetes bacterium]|nr:hypothetical protein [Bacteroidota bacterium]
MGQAGKLFRYLPQYGLSTAFTHLRLSGKWTMAQADYALKHHINARLGRLSKS